MDDTNSSDSEEGNKNCNHTKKVKLDEEEDDENVEGRTITSHSASQVRLYSS